MKETPEMRVQALGWEYPVGGHGYPLQHSLLGNPMHRGAWQAAGHGVTKSEHDSATEHTHNQHLLPRSPWALCLGKVGVTFQRHIWQVGNLGMCVHHWQTSGWDYPGCELHGFPSSPWLLLPTVVDRSGQERTGARTRIQGLWQILNLNT